MSHGGFCLNKANKYEFNPNDVKFKDITPGANAQSKNPQNLTTISYNKEKFKILTTKLPVTTKEKTTGSSKYVIIFDISSNNEDVKQFKDCLEQLDECAKEYLKTKVHPDSNVEFSGHQSVFRPNDTSAMFSAGITQKNSKKDENSNSKDPQILVEITDTNRNVLDFYKIKDNFKGAISHGAIVVANVLYYTIKTKGSKTYISYGIQWKITDKLIVELPTPANELKFLDDTTERLQKKLDINEIQPEENIVHEDEHDVDELPMNNSNEHSDADSNDFESKKKSEN